MKESIVSFILFFTKYKLIKNLLCFVYNFANKSIIKKLSKFSNIKSIYIKGSFLNKTHVLGVSDIDYVLITKQKKDSHSIRSEFDKKHKIFPFIGDVDIYTEKEFNFLIKYGSNKYRNTEEWELVHGEETRHEEYLYYPLKFFIEQMHELFFHIEWTQINFNKFFQKNSLYRRNVLKRGVKKIYFILSWINKNESFKPSNQLEALEEDSYNKVITDILENKSLTQLSQVINSNEALNYYHDLLPREFAWFEENFTEELIDESQSLISVGKFKYIKEINNDDQSSIYFKFSEKSSDLFIKTGCFHTDNLINVSTNSKNRLCGTVISLFNHAKQIEKYNVDINVEKQKTFQNLEKLVDGRLNLKRSAPYNFKLKTVFITANWGVNKNRFRALKKSAFELEKQEKKLPWLHFDMQFNTNDFVEHPNNMEHFKILGNEQQKNMWQKECLYNFAAHYAFGAKNYIFSDADVYSKDFKWTKKFTEMLDTEEYDFVHGFGTVTDTLDKDYKYESWTKKYLRDEVSYTAPGLCWGIPRKSYIVLEYLPDIFPDGSNDGALLQELTGVKMGSTSEFDWYSTRIRTFKNEFNIGYCDVDLIHCNHGVSRDYINRVTLIDLVNIPFEQMYEKDYLGIYSWNANEDYRSALDLSSKYFQLNSIEYISLIDDLVKKKIIKIPSEMIFWNEYPHDHYLKVENGIGVLYKTGKDSYKVLTSKYNENSKLKLRWGGYDLMDNEHLYGHFNVKKKKGDLFNISVNYNWWRLAGSNNTYDKKYFVNMNKQPLAVCASSWEDNAKVFIDIESEHYTAGSSYEISKQTEERINFFHAWDFVGENVISSKHLEISKNSFEIPLDQYFLSKNGWLKVDLKLIDIEKVPLKLTVVSGPHSLPVTTTRMFDDSTADYLRVLFYKNSYLNNMRLKVKLDIKKEVEFDSIKIMLSERRKI